ncbi:MAG: hypothetical protein V7767_11080 [Leeuwenhoekiella sp.]
MVYWRYLLIFFWASGFGQHIEYFKDLSLSHSILSIMEVNFRPLDDTNLGIDNGTYWLKISEVANDSDILRIKTTHVNQIETYDSSGSSLIELPNMQYPSFDFTSNIDHLPFYIKLNLKEEANLPIEFFKHENLIKVEQANIFGYGLFYGIMVFIILATFLLYLYSFESTLLFYAALLLAIGLSLAFRDNIPYLLGLNSYYLSHIELITHVIVGVVGCFFSFTFTNHKSRFPSLKLATLTFVILSVIFFTGHLLTDNFLFYALTDICVLFALISTWIISISASSTAFFYFASFVYAINIYFVLEFFILYDFGISLLNITPFVIKMGIIAQMIVMASTILKKWQYLRSNNFTLLEELTQRNLEIDKLSQYKKVEDINDSYLENLINNYNLNNNEVKILHALSTGVNEDNLAKKLNLSHQMVKQTTTSLYYKLGITDETDFLNLID